MSTGPAVAAASTVPHQRGLNPSMARLPAQLKSLRHKFEAAKKAGYIPDTKVSSAGTSPSTSKVTSPTGSVEALNGDLTANGLAPTRRDSTLSQPGSLRRASTASPTFVSTRRDSACGSSVPSIPYESTSSSGPGRRNSGSGPTPEPQLWQQDEEFAMERDAMHGIIEHLRKQIDEKEEQTIIEKEEMLATLMSHVKLYIEDACKELEKERDELSGSVARLTAELEKASSAASPTTSDQGIPRNSPLKRDDISEELRAQQEKYDAKILELQQIIDTKDNEVYDEKSYMAHEMMAHLKIHMDKEAWTRHDAIVDRDAAISERDAAVAATSDLTSQLESTKAALAGAHLELEGYRNAQPPGDEVNAQLLALKETYEAKIRDVQQQVDSKDNEFYEEKDTMVNDIMAHLKIHMDKEAWTRHDALVERDAAAAVKAELVAELEATKSSLTGLTYDRDAAEASRKELAAELETAHSTIADVTSARDAAVAAQANLASELESTRATIEEIRGQLENAQTQLNRNRDNSAKEWVLAQEQYEEKIRELQQIIDSKDNEFYDEKTSFAEEIMAHLKVHMDGEAWKRHSAVVERDSAQKELENALAERDTAINERDLALADRQIAVADLQTAVEERNAALVERDRAVEDRNGSIAATTDLATLLGSANFTIADMTIELDSTKHTLSIVTTELDSMKQSLADVTAELESTKCSLSEVSAELESKRVMEVDLTTELESARVTIAQTTAGLDAAEMAKSELMAELDAANSTILKLRADQATEITAKQELIRALESSKSAMAELTAEIDYLRQSQQYDSNSSVVEQYEQKVQVLQQELTTKYKEFAEEKAELEADMRAQLQALMDKDSMTKQNGLDAALKSNIALAAELENVQAECDEAQTNVLELTSQLEAIAADKDAALEEIRQLRDLLAEADAQLAENENQFANLDFSGTGDSLTNPTIDNAPMSPSVDSVLPDFPYDTPMLMLTPQQLQQHTHEASTQSLHAEISRLRILLNEYETAAAHQSDPQLRILRARQVDELADLVHSLRSEVGVLTSENERLTRLVETQAFEHEAERLVLEEYVEALEAERKQPLRDEAVGLGVHIT
ncbi:hypothetical protein DFJ77DRAFT_476917 [Powellomyces hirtus]|nr:hypothetical protein DFJ77DRAFT_476917 [Powellomyces hirtus]